MYATDGVIVAAVMLGGEFGCEAVLLVSSTKPAMPIPEMPKMMLSTTVGPDTFCDRCKSFSS